MNASDQTAANLNTALAAYFKPLPLNVRLSADPVAENRFDELEEFYRAKLDKDMFSDTETIHVCGKERKVSVWAAGWLTDYMDDEVCVKAMRLILNNDAPGLLALMQPLAKKTINGCAEYLSTKDLDD